MTLINVLHVPNIRKNSVSATLVGKQGIRVIYDSGKLIFSRNGEFVGKGYLSDGMTKLNID